MIFVGWLYEEASAVAEGDHQLFERLGMGIDCEIVVLSVSSQPDGLIQFAREAIYDRLGNFHFNDRRLRLSTGRGIFARIPTV